MDLLIQNELSEIFFQDEFGENLKFLSFEPNTNLFGKDHLNSTVIFGTVTISNGSKFPVLIKTKIRNPILRERFRADIHFHNEIIMYEKIIPFFLTNSRSIIRDDNVPSLVRYFYGRNKCGEFSLRDMIILEDVSPLGFRLSEEKLFLDYDHLVNAIQTLAKFHALTYVSKHVDPVGFRKTVSDFRETQWTADGQWLLSGSPAVAGFGGAAADRLLERDGDRYRDNEHLLKFRELIADGNNSIRRTLEPREPLSVVCHGDFNRNNMMFRYRRSVDGDRVADALPFNFATSRYGSPALDLSFFLYMNSDRTVREGRYDDLLDAYCVTLAATVPARSGVYVPDRADLDAEMARCALFGFAHVSFFLPFSLLDLRPEASTDETDWNETLLKKFNDEELDLTADALQHLIDMGYTNV